MGSDLLFCTAHMANVTQWSGKGCTAGARFVVFFLLGVVALAAVGALGCKKTSLDSDGPGKNSHASPIKAVLHLEPFVVNLADSEENRFLRVGIDLGLGNPLPSKEGRGAEGEVPIARIRDCILTVVSTWRSDALLAPEGKEKLKEELIHALRDRAPELGVKEVYFTDFLVQR
jgi:flagellar FliL protein